MLHLNILSQYIMVQYLTKTNFFWLRKDRPVYLSDVVVLIKINFLFSALAVESYVIGFKTNKKFCEVAWEHLPQNLPLHNEHRSFYGTKFSQFIVAVC